MRVLEPLTVRVQGWPGRRHEFHSADRQLAALSASPRGGRQLVYSQDGPGISILPAQSPWPWHGRLGRRAWYLWWGESEVGRGEMGWAARHAELVYGAVPYLVEPAGPLRRYRVINEADTEVLTIAFRGPLRREATLYPHIALDLALLVFAYDLARRLL
jgi:hypothetical protein